MKPIEEFVRQILRRILADDIYSKFDVDRILELREKVEKGTNEVLEVFKFLEFSNFFHRYDDLDPNEFFEEPLYVRYYPIDSKSSPTRSFQKVYSSYDSDVKRYRHFIFNCEDSSNIPTVTEVVKCKEYVPRTYFKVK